MITGWYSSFPVELYELKYFKFKRPVGGHANDGPEISFAFQADDISDFKQRLKNYIIKYPYGRCSLRSSNGLFVINIIAYTLVDYDFLFAYEIESLIDEFGFSVLKEDFSLMDYDYTRYEGDKIKNLPFYSFKSKNITYHNFSHNGIFGSSNTTIYTRMINSNPKRTKDLISEVKNITIKCDFLYVWINKQLYKGKDFLNLYVTNGRQGVNFSPYHVSDLEKYDVSIERLFEKYELIPRIETNSYDEYKKAYPNNGIGKEEIKLIGDYDKMFE
jgi:hypothetical protein